MTLATLTEVLQPALKHGYAVGGLVCLGWEDMRGYVAAAEAENAPVILQAGPGCRAHTPLPVLAAMFRNLAENASVPVVAHLDHGYTYEECREAIDCGFSSIMFDGSRNSVSENIDMTAKIVEMAKTAGVSVEGEIGFVGYSNGESSAGTHPDDAARFAAESGVDALAVSIGNVHLQQDKAAHLDIAALRAIEAVTSLPLVIHGGSGVPVESRSFLAKESNICKFNIGTELRMAFGQALHIAVNQDPNRFDRIAILKETVIPVQLAAQQVIRAFGAPAQR
jgi:fructose-bisphosphate aldolase class II